MKKRESIEYSQQWSGGLPTMNLSRPANYELLATEDPKADHSYVWESSEYFDTQGDETSYSVRFEYDGQSTSVTYFPDREGVKLTAGDSPGYEEGKERAVLGLVLIKLLRSGEMVMKEL